MERPKIDLSTSVNRIAGFVTVPAEASLSCIATQGICDGMLFSYTLSLLARGRELDLIVLPALGFNRLVSQLDTYPEISRKMTDFLRRFKKN